MPRLAMRALPARRSILAALLCGAPRAAAAARRVGRGGDPLPKLVDNLGNAPSFKVRIQAAAVLARMKDPRVVGALGRAATSDDHPAVRAQAVRLLGRNPGGEASDARAREAIGRALKDPNAGVRAAAGAALAALDARARRLPKKAAVLEASTQAPPAPVAPPPRTVGGKRVIAVGAMGDRSGKASATMRDRMRKEVAKNLRADPALAVAEIPARDAVGVASFVVDGVISKLEHVTRGSDVETICAVELVVSRPPRGILLVSTGEAIVQRPRATVRPQSREAIEAEALTHAVRSAHDNLNRFFRTQ
jgi:hypothetical protein